LRLVNEGKFVCISASDWLNQLTEIRKKELLRKRKESHREFRWETVLWKA